jgi:heterodisulfide reductase subunit C
MPEEVFLSQGVKKKAPSELEDFWGSEIGVQDCYQCQKCSAGCPVAFAMDYKPTQIMQMVSLGMKERVLSSKTIWVWASC